jgi:hypothetical protein
MATVNAERLSQALHLSEARVYQLVKEGLPKEGKGQYDPIKCMYWYICYLQAALEKKSVPTLDGGYAGEKDQRVRLLTVDANLKELQFAKERGDVILIAESEKIMSDLVLTTKARIMAIGARVAPDLVGETSRVMIQAKIEKALKEALAYLAKAGADGTAAKQPS